MFFPKKSIKFSNTTYVYFNYLYALNKPSVEFIYFAAYFFYFFYFFIRNERLFLIYIF